MNVRFRRGKGAIRAASLLILLAPVALRAEDPPRRNPAANQTTKGAAKSAARVVQPKPLSDSVKSGLAYLVSQQHENGGWGQGGGWRTGSEGGRVEGAGVEDLPDVANTCVATLALLRAGSTPQEGAHQKNVAKAAEFIIGSVEKSDAKSIYVTEVRNTQLQSKIGQYVDTFLAALALSELKGDMPDPQSEKRLAAALQKAISKIETNQKADGNFAGNVGWASVLSQGLGSKALSRARQKGAGVSDEALRRDYNQIASNLDVRSGEFKRSAEASGYGGAGIAGGGFGGGGYGAASAEATATPPELAQSGRSRLPAKGARRAQAAAEAEASAGAATAPSDAGISLYGSSTNTNRLQDLANTGAVIEKHAREVLASESASKASKDQAEQQLARVAEVKEARETAVAGILKRLDDPQFLAGFGNNGGEEFLSYMNISETLVVRGGQEWERWDRAISDTINRVQNSDGSWSGDHCITGRTFCTSAALLTLLADRSPASLAAAQPAEPKR